ncbi:MAG: heparan-alpha-glucosaminide N-acetyltransferase domain-containing protein, partial [Firmicutes bacterium]|nr:heparan-alpha-glucosaminide N-acetyltransferase domain-containing protein [Bacillota bacterium]
MNRYRGLDVLRGFGVFFLLGLHSAFYYFGGLYDLDLNHPPLIITILGFLLMFAGLFAILSGFGHTISMERDFQAGVPICKIIKKKMVAGLIILVVA